jgi:hypothetical protein
MIYYATQEKTFLSPKVKCQLCDSFVGSVLSYGAEVCGFTKCQYIERVHLTFCKYILGVKLCASNAGDYGELWRYPLYINRSVRIIKFWIKVINSENCVIRAVYNVSTSDIENEGCHNRVYNVRDILCTTGFDYVWENIYAIQLVFSWFSCI